MLSCNKQQRQEGTSVRQWIRHLHNSVEPFADVSRGDNVPESACEEVRLTQYSAMPRRLNPKMQAITSNKKSRPMMWLSFSNRQIEKLWIPSYSSSRLSLLTEAFHRKASFYCRKPSSAFIFDRRSCPVLVSCKLLPLPFSHSSLFFSLSGTTRIDDDQLASSLRSSSQKGSQKDSHPCLCTVGTVQYSTVVWRIQKIVSS